MSTDEDRMWNVRDAILLWLYREAIAGHRMPRYDLNQIQKSVGWVAKPLTEDDWASATGYLREEGYITGSASWGGGVIRPAITAKGENQAASGKSVRPGPEVDANTTGVTNNYTITNTGQANIVAGNSGTANQSISTGMDASDLIAVADALGAHVATVPDDADKFRDLETNLRKSATDPGANRNLIITTLGGILTSVATIANSENYTTDNATGDGRTQPLDRRLTYYALIRARLCFAIGW